MSNARVSTLAEFIDLSMTATIVPVNLPAGIKAADAAKKLRREDIKLRDPLGNDFFKSGWFDPTHIHDSQGNPLIFITRKVVRVAGQEGIGFELTLHEPALTLLR